MFGQVDMPNGTYLGTYHMPLTIEIVTSYDLATSLLRMPCNQAAALVSNWQWWWTEAASKQQTCQPYCVYKLDGPFPAGVDRKCPLHQYYYILYYVKPKCKPIVISLLNIYYIDIL